MAFRATVPVTEQAFDRIRAQAAASKAFLTNSRNAMAQSTSPATVALTVIQHLGQTVLIMEALAATPGLAQYARDQVNDQAYDVGAEFTTMKNAMIAARDSLISTFPKDGSNFLLYQTLNADGTIATRTFTAAGLAAAVAQIDAVIAAIS